MKTNLITLLSVLLLANFLSSKLTAANEIEPSINLLSLSKELSSSAPDLAEFIVTHEDISDHISCEDIPNNKNKLCVISKANEINHYLFDTAFFVKTVDDNYKILENFNSFESSFGYIGFSPEGTYLYVVFAEEGHPFFIFFQTDLFLKNSKDAQVGKVLDDYYLSHVEKLYDDGRFVYQRRINDIESCEVVKRGADDTEYCQVTYDIKDVKVYE